MKAHLLTLIFPFFCALLQAQERQLPDSPFPVRSTRFYQGFEKIIGGNQLDYPPILQKGKLALMVTPNGQAAEFLTASMPETEDERITFIWQASMARSTGERPANFDLFINGMKHFTFKGHRNDGEKDWIYRNGGYELAFIATAPEDEHGNLLGYNFLTVPKGDFPAGQPLNLKVAAEDAILPGAYIAFQNVVETSLQVFAFQALKRREGRLWQPVLVEFTHTGQPVSAGVFFSEKKQYDQPLQPGLNQFYIWVEPVSAPIPAAVEVVFENGEKRRWRQDILLKPVRLFEVYFLPHSHVDVGFTHLQHEVEKMQWRNFVEAIELSKKTADYPDGARYKWNVEVLWAVDGYLKNAAPNDRTAFIDAVKKGWIGLDALYGSELTGLQRPEELNLDAPLVETGEMHGQRWMSDPATEPWLKTWTPSNRLFSWVMNNVWFVNYKGHQEGLVPFRYAIRPHRGFDSAEAKKFGIGLVQPLLIAPVAEGQPGFSSMLKLSGDPAVIATCLKPARDGKGYLVRLFNTSDRTAAATLQWGGNGQPKWFLSNEKEKVFEEVKGQVTLGAWEIKTLRVMGK